MTETDQRYEPNKPRILDWIYALESGDYKQAREELRRPIGDGEYGHCCLGVACDKAKEAVGGEWVPDTSYFKVDPETGERQNSSTTHLVPEVADWLGIPAEMRVGGPVQLNIALGSGLATELNDVSAKSFEEIASEIREAFDFPTREEEIKANRLVWIEALESGDYDQGQGGLRPSGSKFCCLGVACDKAKEAVGGEWVPDTSYFKVNDESRCGTSYFKVNDESRCGTLPAAVSHWLGTNPTSGEPKFQSLSASTLNDVHCKSFAEIAAYARQEWGFPPREEASETDA